MTPPLRAADIPEVVYRLGRKPDPWEWPDWSRANPDRSFVSRYDDPEGRYRVLYASTEREATLRECLARFIDFSPAAASFLSPLVAKVLRASRRVGRREAEPV